MLIFNIQYFADEGASATTGDIGAVTTDTDVGSAADSNDLSNVQYGVQDEVSAPQATEQSETTTRQSLKELLKADAQLKAEYDAEMQKTLKRRLKSSEAKTSAYDSLKPSLAVLAQYYGKDENDINGISEAIKGDNTYFKRQALDEGRSADEVKDTFWLQRKNKELSDQMEEIKRERENQKLFQKWNEEIPEVERLYGELDMDAEMENEEFAKLAFAAGIRTAYEHVHRDEINSRMMAYAQNKGAQAVANTIAANKARPTEGGLNAKVSPPAKTDVDNLSPKDFKEISRRVRAGEKIIF